MSTELQLQGDSRRRQLEASRAYAEAHGLELAQGAELEDIGVSAFKGANVRDGALGRFLEAVKAGSVKAGSYLIVELLDRLSREQVLTAQSLFLRIIQAGIHLVTLTDGRVYRAGTADLGDLIISLVIMSWAHEESQTKSHRVSAAWKNKRSQAAGQKPMTKWCPAWLILSPDRRGYLRVPERVEIIRQIFSDVTSGVGMYSVARRLNDAGVLPFASPNGWHQSYIAKILGNRAVLGEFQPHARIAGKRVPQGEPIKDYFPAIIDENLFYQAQYAKSQRRGGGAGRKGKAYTNLFSGIAKCAYCRSPILFENKGSGAKGGTYLICDSAKRHLGCPGLRWRYRDFESSFLAFVEELDVNSIVNASQLGEKQKLEVEVAALQGELAAVNDLMEKTYAVLSGGGPVEFVTSKLNELERRRSELAEKLRARTTEHEQLASRELRYHHSKQEIRTLVDRLQRVGDNDDMFALRARVASQLKSLIGTLTVASVGERPLIMSRLEQLHRSEEPGEDAIAHIEQRAARPDQGRRYFSVGFRDSKVRIVFPVDDDPLRYEQQVTASELWGIERMLPDN